VLPISNVSRILCGVILITVPTIEYGGAFLLESFRNRQPYMENPLRQSLFRAGHAHAGVLVILSLVCQVLMDSIILPAPLEWFARLATPVAAILVPAGFFFSVIPPKGRSAQRLDCVDVPGSGGAGSWTTDPRDRAHSQGGGLTYS